MAAPAHLDPGLFDEAAAALNIDLGDQRQVVDLVAVAMARLAWRDGPVENWHQAGRISNSEMMRANAASARLLREVPTGGRVATAAGDAVGSMGDMVGAVGCALANPGRRLPDGRTLTEVASDPAQVVAFERHVWMFCTRWNRVAARYGVPEIIALLALYAGRYCWRWWLAPGWPHVVDEYIRRLDDPARWGDPVMAEHVARVGAPNIGGGGLRVRLLAGPDQLTAAVAARCFRRAWPGCDRWTAGSRRCRGTCCRRRTSAWFTLRCRSLAEAGQAGAAGLGGSGRVGLAPPACSYGSHHLGGD